MARHEKAAEVQLMQRGVETFLPLRLDVRKWGNRNALVEFPLFSGYLFTHILCRERLKVLTVRGVIRIVSFNGMPSPVADQEIIALRGVSGQASIKPHKFLEVGRKVRIQSGPLRGLEGVVVKRKSNIRMIVSVQAIRQSISVEISESNLQCFDAATAA
jgi:transcription antitermination factor NusG